MRNLYYLQYQILLTALAAFFIFYTLVEYSLVTEIYSVSEGLNTTATFKNRIFHHLYEAISKNSLLLNILFLLRIPICIGFLFGLTRKFCFLLMLINITLFQHIGDVRSPDVEFLNFLMLILIAIPEKKFSFFAKNKNKFWMYPRSYQFLARIVAGLAYSTSGYYKFLTPRWYDGTYIYTLLTSSPMRNFDLHILLSYDVIYGCCVFLNYFVLATELLALPMVFNKYTRPISFLILSLMHVFIFILIDIQEVSLGLLVFHIFLFDPRWLRFKIPFIEKIKARLGLVTSKPIPVS